ncbi:sodium-independent sulfate anion transporter [Anabrus simplex]|uniref:sodium-independent sulfate anion transporter n=1 Tax=Anabrus simplex TaxID=316456 RepID=UPI0035A3B57A
MTERSSISGAVMDPSITEPKPRHRKVSRNQTAEEKPSQVSLVRKAVAGLIEETSKVSSLMTTMDSGTAGRAQGQTDQNNLNYILMEDDSFESMTTKEYLSDVFSRTKEKLVKGCSKKMLRRRVPILTWLPRYNSHDALGDLVAGITVGLTVIPQSLAYSNVAGLPAQYGLYGSFLGCFIYIIFGSCKDVPMGPTAIMSLLTYQTVRGKGPEYAVLLCFLNGIVELFMGLLGLGFIIDFISGPVSSGFTSAAALIIVTSQIKDVLAVKAQGNTFIGMWSSLFSNMWASKPGDCIMGCTCIVVLILMRYLVKIQVGPKEESLQTKLHRAVNKFIWLVGTSRNAILVVVCGIIGYNFSLMDDVPFELIGYIPPGMPAFQLPPFGFTKIDNGTEKYIDFVDMCSELGSGIIVLPLVGLLESIAICKAFSNGKPVDATQELLAIGLGNISNSFVQGFPGCGSLSRSAVNNSSGVRTTLGGLYTGILVIFALLFFTPYFSFIPKAALAAIIIAAVIFMVEVHVVIPIWKTKKSDLIPGIGTFIACLVLQLELGILVGIGINILFILYHAARPKIAVENLTTPEGVDYLVLTPDRSLIFPSVDYVRNLVTKHGIKQAIPVVIDCSHIYGADYTAAKVIECLTQDFSSRKQPLFFYNLKRSVVSIFSGLQPKGFVVYYAEEELDDLIRGHQKQSAAASVTTEISVVSTG